MYEIFFVEKSLRSLILVITVPAKKDKLTLIIVQWFYYKRENDKENIPKNP